MLRNAAKDEKSTLPSVLRKLIEVVQRSSQSLEIASKHDGAATSKSLEDSAYNDIRQFFSELPQMAEHIITKGTQELEKKQDYFKRTQVVIFKHVKKHDKFYHHMLLLEWFLKNLNIYLKENTGIHSQEAKSCSKLFVMINGVPEADLARVNNATGKELHDHLVRTNNENRLNLLALYIGAYRFKWLSGLESGAVIGSHIKKAQAFVDMKPRPVLNNLAKKNIRFLRTQAAEVSYLEKERLKGKLEKDSKDVVPEINLISEDKKEEKKQAASPPIVPVAELESRVVVLQSNLDGKNSVPPDLATERQQENKRAWWKIALAFVGIVASLLAIATGVGALFGAALLAITLSEVVAITCVAAGSVSAIGGGVYLWPSTTASLMKAGISDGSSPSEKVAEVSSVPVTAELPPSSPSLQIIVTPPEPQTPASAPQRRASK